MGSLISTPKAAPTPIALQTQTTEPVTSISETSQGSETNESSTASASEIREANLLKRDRSRFGTIATSFRGFLDLADRNNSNRKTLLGE
ncbi:MAG: hypothetical protein OEY94_06850 [Alphaproteobacteria bacterium]|nr:hypothetical protein [Alphaproteobacteria bacterium]